MKRSDRLNYLLLTYVAGIVIFTLFRLTETAVYYFGNAEALPAASAEGGSPFFLLYLHALAKGWRFDTTVSCYLLALPVLLLAAGEIGHIARRGYYKFIHCLVLVGYIVCFLACSADIPFFNYFFTRLNATASNEADSFAIVADMIASEPAYIVWGAVFIAVSVGYCFLMRTVFRRTIGRQPLPATERNNAYHPRWASIPLTALLIFLTFFGMRGRPFDRCPIRVATAYFCTDPFLNMIGLNPVFTFVKSAGEIGKTANQPVSLLPAEDALCVWEEEQSQPKDEKLLPAGLTLPLPEGTNVVVVLMESMSAEKTALAAHSSSLTPCLDSLMRQSLTFTRLYSSGTHTYNGIYSVLYSHPCYPSRHTMKRTFVPVMHGLPQTLKERGYQTAYFMTHNQYFDNLNAFLYNNAIDSIYDVDCYPADAPRNSWGVPDHYMFDAGLRYCGRAAKQGPFFCVMMTCSDHPPYAFPEGTGLQPRSGNLEQQMVEYADWAIGRFVRMARRQPWFDNTLFVFVGDHGQLWGPTPYDVPLSYHRVPLLFFCPSHIAPQQCPRLAAQTDICPTLLGMLYPAYQDHNFGLDLLRQRREMLCFIEDDKICTMDSEYLFVHRMSEDHESMYHYCNETPGDQIATQQPRADRMRRYAFGMIQQSYNLTTDVRHHK